MVYPNLSWCGSAERCSGSSFGATLLVCRWSQRSGLSLARDRCAFGAWSINLLQAWKGLSTIEWNGLFPCPWVLIANSFWLEVGPTFPFQCCDPAWLEAVRSCECCYSPYGFICAAVLFGRHCFLGILHPVWLSQSLWPPLQYRSPSLERRGEFGDDISLGTERS